MEHKAKPLMIFGVVLFINFMPPPKKKWGTGKWRNRVTFIRIHWNCNEKERAAKTSSPRKIHSNLQVTCCTCLFSKNDILASLTEQCPVEATAVAALGISGAFSRGVCLDEMAAECKEPDDLETGFFGESGGPLPPSTKKNTQNWHTLPVSHQKIHTRYTHFF